jgi:hypothetical protein
MQGCRILCVPDPARDRGWNGQAMSCETWEPGHRPCRPGAREKAARRARSGIDHRRRGRFIAAAARDGPVAPRTRGSAMTRKGFVTCIARERTPAVRPWQIVAPGILPFRETGPAIRLLRAQAQEVPAFRSGSRCGRHLFQHPAEPCRDGNHKTGNPETENHSQTLRRFLQAGRRSLQPVAAEETPKPLRRRRLWSGMRATRYSAPGSGMSPNPAMVQS